jgi:hypothetical protein
MRRLSGDSVTFRAEASLSGAGKRRFGRESVAFPREAHRWRMCRYRWRFMDEGLATPSLWQNGTK